MYSGVMGVGREAMSDANYHFSFASFNISQEAEKYASEENLLFLEASAKESYNVSELFTMIARKLPLEQATNAQRATRGSSNLMGSNQQGGRGGVDLQGQSSQNTDACNC
jgi:Ras-related protein Rab-5C